MADNVDVGFLQRRIEELQAAASGRDSQPVSLRDAPDGRTYDAVSDPITRTEIAAQVAAAEARADGNFQRVNDQLTAIRNGQLGLAALAFAAIAIVVAVLAYAGEWFGLGLQSHDSLIAAAKEGAAQALAAKR